ncbi:MAG: mono/diheme cytochrome c family protein [Myxococcota bacterium]|jgi:mono/diheme cytochrome c family protein
MHTASKVGLGVMGVVGMTALVSFGYVQIQKNARLSATYSTHDFDLAVPIPLSEAEIGALRAEREKAAQANGTAIAAAQDGAAELAEGASAADAIAAIEATEPMDVLASVDLPAIAQARAQERGKHLVESRFACIECHGADFSGGTMVDDGAMGTWLGPNLTEGEGSVTKDYAMKDWDAIVRHGVKKDGTAAIMPSEDFVNMSNRELSDIVSYIRSVAPVNNTVPSPTFGPIGSVLLATGALPLSAESAAGHTEHADEPPETAVTVEFGKHLSQVCTGCHRADLNGGPIPIGPPDWPPSRNLTPHESGMKGWTLDQFRTAMTEGKRPDGSALLAPMDLMMPYAKRMTDVELEALFMYLQSLPPTETGT